MLRCRRLVARLRLGPTSAALIALAVLLDFAPLPAAPLTPPPTPAPTAAGRGLHSLSSSAPASSPREDEEWPELAAFFQVFRRPKASAFVLSNFRKHYPRGTVFMVNDGGGEEAHAALAALAAEHGALYSLEEHNPAGPRQNFAGMQDSALRWLARLLNASCAVLERGRGERFMLLLEDDVWVMNRTRAAHLSHDLNAIEPGFPVFNSATLDYMRAQQPLLTGRPLVLAGFGGSIFRTAFLCEMWREWPRVEADVGSFYGLVDGGLAASDILLSFLTYLRGGTTGNYPGRTEPWHGDYAERMRRQPSDVEVVHDYKVYYRRRR